MTTTIYETEWSVIRLVPAPGARRDLSTSLMPTIAPWKIAEDHSGKLTKILAMSGPISQYSYGTGWDVSKWRLGWQKGLICSFGSGLVVHDEDDPKFLEFMRSAASPSLTWWC